MEYEFIGYATKQGTVDKGKMTFKEFVKQFGIESVMYLIVARLLKRKLSIRVINEYYKF